jgi:hypothetical protein
MVEQACFGQFGKVCDGYWVVGYVEYLCCECIFVFLGMNEGFVLMLIRLVRFLRRLRKVVTVGAASQSLNPSGLGETCGG